MRLKRLVARGFKSFADRTEFEFDSRLTGIIGPNGCGKSNVVDAIKWVLGDQRAKSLRGSEMTDVIFKGAEGREAMGMAEVTITFEDPDGKLEGRTEIDISRRLTLEKESTYLLNGSEVRLKDVRDVLLDTGLGTGGYSVMEQGRIDAVLSANPEARRAIFEEAAGISRFKLQKKESLRKLERTDQNLARITDLLEDRARRIRSLRIQAGKARRYQELAAALRDLRAAVAVVEGTELLSLLQAQRAAMQELEVALESAGERRDAAAEKVALGEAEVARCAEALDAVRTELSRCGPELSTQREREESQRRRQAEMRGEAESARARGEALAAQRVERAVALDAAREDLAAREEAVIALQTALEAQRQCAAECQQRLRAAQKEREAVRAAQLELVHQRTRIRNQGVDQEAKIAAARARTAKLDERLQALSAEQAQLDTEQAALAQRHGFAQTRARVLHEREQGAIRDLAQADGAAADLAALEAELRHEWSQIDGRREALMAMEAQHEGLDQGPRHVLAQQPQGLRGRLVDLLDVDLRYSAALEAALGAYVQALVVDTRANAAAIVRDLQAQRLGRVLLLVEEDFADEVRGPSLLPLPSGAERLLDLVRPAGGDAASARLLAFLLRGVVLVDSLDAADASRADLCFVTKDGALVCGPRMEGGESAEGHAGLVVRRSQIQELAARKEEVEGRLAELVAGKERAVSRVDSLKQEVRSLGLALQQARQELQSVEGGLMRVGARSADLAREGGELGQERAELFRVVCSGLAILGRSLFNQRLLTDKEAARAAAETRWDEQIAEIDREVQGAVQKEQELRVQQAQQAEGRDGLIRSIRMHEESLRGIDDALEELVVAVEHKETAAQRAGEEAERFAELASALSDRIAELEEQRLSRAAAHDERRHEHRLAQDELARCDDEARTTAERRNQSRLALVEVEHRFARLEERLREDVGVELLRCLGQVSGLGIELGPDFVGPPCPEGLVAALQGPPLPPAWIEAHYGMRRLWLTDGFDPLEARREVQQLQSQKDRLGAVNHDAVEELAQEEGQLGNLEQEVADLKESRRALMETLRRLEAESKSLFEQTFAEARKNFQEIFRKLFQGGKADMFLHESDDLLEAGIEIVAQPPGKQLTSINLLSGGERSMTAVAILFALFKVRPSPFCILDEVDAALDETNVERFLRVLRDFIAGTQFCIVTHHKRTMAECQALYGITMQRRGVSSRIAVQLHEVDRFQSGEPTETTRKDPAKKQRIAGEEAVGF